MKQRNNYTDLTGSIDEKMKRKILNTARKEFPAVPVNITVRRQKFYYTDRSGYVIKTIVMIEPQDTTLQPVGLYIKDEGYVKA
jgi:phosphatidate phosphatase APP1